MRPRRTAVVTGASGLVGGNLAVLLAREGHAVRALFRSEKSVAHLKHAPLQFVKGRSR